MDKLDLDILRNKELQKCALGSIKDFTRVLKSLQRERTRLLRQRRMKNRRTDH